MIHLRDRISAAAHEEVPHANPLSAAQMDGLVLQALRHNPATALDIGCGPGAFSVGLAARAPFAVVAIDVNPHGVLVFADLVWNAEPAEEYLANLGGQRDFYWLAPAVEMP